MGRLFGSKDGPKVERSYVRHDADYWENQQSLADLILGAVKDGEVHQSELSRMAEDAGYSKNYFYQTISNLKSEGAIDKYGSTISAGEVDYNGDDGL